MFSLFVCVFLIPTTSLFSLNKEAEVRVAYFYPTSKKVRDIYGSGLPLYQVELSYDLCNRWSGWTSVGYLSKHGHSIGLHDDTRIHFYPIGLGVKHTFELPCHFEAYLGGGATYSILHIKDHSSYVKENVRKNNLGGVVKTGILYHVSECFFFDLFFDYSYTKYHFSGTHDNIKRNNLTMSGLQFGAGAGVSF